MDKFIIDHTGAGIIIAFLFGAAAILAVILVAKHNTRAANGGDRN